MNTVYVLIMILGGTAISSGYAVVVAEFNTLEACESARKHIAMQNKSAPVNADIGQIRAQGCYEKGIRK